MCWGGGHTVCELERLNNFDICLCDAAGWWKTTVGELKESNRKSNSIRGSQPMKFHQPVNTLNTMLLKVFEGPKLDIMSFFPTFPFFKYTDI